jgi:hypothetical protein
MLLDDAQVVVVLEKVIDPLRQLPTLLEKKYFILKMQKLYSSCGWLPFGLSAVEAELPDCSNDDIQAQPQAANTSRRNMKLK